MPTSIIACRRDVWGHCEELVQQHVEGGYWQATTLRDCEGRRYTCQSFEPDGSVANLQVGERGIFVNAVDTLQLGPDHWLVGCEAIDWLGNHSDLIASAGR